MVVGHYVDWLSADLHQDIGVGNVGTVVVREPIFFAIRKLDLKFLSFNKNWFRSVN